MPRFVLLHHECPPGYERPSHWDLMLESGAVLRTWALRQLPAPWQQSTSDVAMSEDSIVAEQLADHRPAYLDYEGRVGGERGTVTRVDAGTFATLAETPGRWEVELCGDRVRGRVTLERQAGDAPRWTLTFTRG